MRAADRAQACRPRRAEPVWIAVQETEVSLAVRGTRSYTGGVDDFAHLVPGQQARAGGLSHKEVELLVQFAHPPKILALAGLPGAAALGEATLARLLGTTSNVYEAIRESLAARARTSAEELFAQPGIRAAAERLPFRDDDVIVAVGDSITDDRQSWAEILRNLLNFGCNASRVRLLNAGVSGQSTSDVVSRLLRARQVEPDWVVVLVGTNDAQRYGPPPGRMRVSLTETARNLQVIREFALSMTPHVVWMTPPPVIEPRVLADESFRARAVRWLNSDLSAISEQVRSLPEPVVDLQSVFDGPDLGDLLLADGLHPSLAGQTKIAATLVEQLTQVGPNGSSPICKRTE